MTLSETLYFVIIYFNRWQSKERDMGAYGIALLSFFSKGISVLKILIITYGIAVSFSPACGFSSFWLSVLGKRGSRNCSLRALSRLNYDEIGRASFSIIVPINSRSSHVSSQWLRLIFGVYMLEINKHSRCSSNRKLFYCVYIA